MTYRCSTCGESHDDLPDMGADRPDHWWNVPAEERDQRIELTSDTCIIDDEHFFVRGVIEIPVHDYSRRFGIGAWVSQKRENFFVYQDNLDSSEIGPFFGWLCTRVAFYEKDTLNLKTMVHFKGRGLRPSIGLEETNHPLSLDQHHGILLARAWEIVHFYMKPGEES